MLVLIYILVLIINGTMPCYLVENFADYNGQYIVYVNEYSEVDLNGVTSVKNYNGQILKSSISKYCVILNNIDAVASETVVINNISVKDIKNKLELNIKDSLTLNGVILYNAYTTKFKRYINANCGKVNIQIAIYSSGEVYVGYPFLVDF